MQGKEAIHFENKPFDPAKWEKQSQRRFSTDIKNIGRINVIEYRVRALTGRQKLIWQWYLVGGNRTNGALKAKLLGILGKVTGNPSISVIISATNINDSAEQATDRLRKFFSEALPSIEASLNSLQK